MSNSIHTLAVEFLGQLEQTEATLLSWGLVDGFWSEQELVAKADAFIAKCDAWHMVPDGHSLVDILEQQHFVIRWDGFDGCRYRSAKHAATGFIKESRPTEKTELLYPAGKGASSIVGALLKAIDADNL